MKLTEAVTTLVNADVPHLLITEGKVFSHLPHSLRRDTANLGVLVQTQSARLARKMHDISKRTSPDYHVYDEHQIALYKSLLGDIEEDVEHPYALILEWVIKGTEKVESTITVGRLHDGDQCVKAAYIMHSHFNGSLTDMLDVADREDQGVH
jgi:hypothetical protein